MQSIRKWRGSHSKSTFAHDNTVHAQIGKCAEMKPTSAFREAQEEEMQTPRPNGGHLWLSQIETLSSKHSTVPSILRGYACFPPRVFF